MSFGGKDNQDQPPLGPPFQRKPIRKDDDEESSQFSPSFEPLLVDSPYYVREHVRPFSVGSEDVGPIPGIPGGQGNGGMIVGPDHPGFWRPERQPNPTTPSFLPPYILTLRGKSLICLGELSRQEPDSIQ